MGNIPTVSLFQKTGQKNAHILHKAAYFFPPFCRVRTGGAGINNAFEALNGIEKKYFTRTVKRGIITLQ